MNNSVCNTIEPNSILENISYATVLINTEFSRGTGFLLQKNIDEKTIVPLLVTNTHVLFNGDRMSKYLKLKFRLANNKNMPINEFCEIVIDDYEQFFNKHPNTTTDLCAINIAKWINQCIHGGKNLFVRYITVDIIPSDEELKNLDYMEEVFMVGYPRGLSDELNNYPIFRRGVTATHPYIDYQGKREFLLDITNIGGSSGSPVFIKKEVNIDKNHNITIGGGHFYFIGICYSSELVHTYTNNGLGDTIPLSNIQTTMNIAHVIKASELIELINLF